MKKNIIVAGVAAAAAVALAGCSQSTSLDTGGPTWRDALADEIDRSMTSSELQEFCDGMALFGIDTPDELGEMLMGFSGDALPAGDTTIAEWAEMTGDSLSDIPFAIDVDEVTVRDFLDETGRIIFDRCDL